MSSTDSVAVQQLPGGALWGVPDAVEAAVASRMPQSCTALLVLRVYTRMGPLIALQQGFHSPSTICSDQPSSQHWGAVASAVRSQVSTCR